MTRQPVSNLPKTLAERVRFLREKRMMTAEGLALKAQIPLRNIEDIEAGIELFLAPAVRQRLARALHVRPTQLQEVEKQPDLTSAENLQGKGLKLHEAILRQPDGMHVCPSCGAPLAVRLFERRDLQDHLIVVVKAHCTQCLFRLSDD